MLETERLNFKVLNGHELKSYATNSIGFATEHHLHTQEKILSIELIDLVNHSFLPHVNDPRKKYIFYTLWLMIDKKSQSIVGSFCFHGEPENGIAEIGYGVNEEFRNQGYMSEALIGLKKWMSTQSNISSVVAETDNNNVASIKTLQKAGFTKFERNELSSIYYYKFSNQEPTK